MNNVIQHVIINGKDDLVVLNGKIILSGEENLSDVVERLQGALNCNVQHEEVDEPKDSDWCYDDVLELIPNFETYTKPTSASISDWFESVKDSKAFIFSGMHTKKGKLCIINDYVCDNFTFGSPDDEDQNYEFLFFGANNFYDEIIFTPENTSDFFVQDTNQVRFSTAKGQYLVKALS